MPAFLRMPALFLVLLTISCSSGGSPDTTPNPDTGDQPRARIENRASLETAVFALPARVTAGATSIRFEARPVRRAGEPVVSELFGVRTGEEIVWSIPPQ